MLDEKRLEVARDEAARLRPGRALAEREEHGPVELAGREVDVAGGEEAGVDEAREDRALQLERPLDEDGAVELVAAGVRVARPLKHVAQAHDAGVCEEGLVAGENHLGPDRAEVVLARDRIEGLHIDPVFTSLLALERRMIRRDSLVLHCAYVLDHGEAILFSAPSETGKTTQANLWEKYRGSRTVNGDRALLGKIDGRWHAQGWPVCGTSEVCNNEAHPIRAIVMLSQAKENRAERLTPGQAFPLLYSQITINRWNMEDHIRAMDLMEKLLAEVPVYHLGCTISGEAVTCLENALREA